MSDTALPLEVYELIVDSLAKKDVGLTSIRACSLVCRAFLPLARKHAFASIEINNPFAPEDRPSPSTESFGRGLDRNPEIGEYVHRVDYCITARDDINHIMSQFLRALVKLTKLKSLTIWHDSVKKIRWRTQDWPMRRVLLHLMQLPTLSHLKLHWIENFPVSDFIYGSSLKHLRVEDIDFAEEDIVPPFASPPPHDSVYLYEGHEWGLLDKTLTKKDAWLGLKAVSLTIKIFTHDAADKEEGLVDALNQLPNTQLQKLSKSGAFNFKFEVAEKWIDEGASKKR
ncbi:hypothetical protein M413DRAFT_28355 [Hebeloma cylindrosporum]|uniref:F-box domain-containing protein n=1 Tax=Hebeloma cylindrosporum TaxID=76867 RepID=A0A0C3BV83_HEBCY|nr:hypothetical protein M413DRAFT_28355 [Hebeloma cylindrosporum h7]